MQLAAVSVVRRPIMARLVRAATVVCGWIAACGVPRLDLLAERPRAHDPRVTITQFASQPDIVHPVGVTFDDHGRLLVIESHTHFPPDGYQGLPHDRIRVVEDTDADGRADRFTTFFEGTIKTMDIATAHDGAIYVATRNEILRLRDTTGDGRADERTRIVFLDTEGDYPHNGLSGLAFDSAGDLYFGLGENLGAAYQLIGSDGAKIADEGEGGNIFWCTADGKHLRCVATGFWNPFGVCIDPLGRIFAIDNDPDSSPPCRLLHVVEGGNYGYQFRYGRSGRHPFQAWNGQLPGTLPMVAGTGEAPCEIISYQSDGLPEEYVDDLLVASWAEHRVERYALRPRGASYVAERIPFIEGDNDFRPVGIATAPDGSLYVSDWVLRDYKLHGRGAIWRIQPRKPTSPRRPRDRREALLSAHRPLREAAARHLASAGAAGRRHLHERLAHQSVAVRAAAIAALVNVGDKKIDLPSIVEKDPSAEVRAMAARAMTARGVDARRFLDDRYPPGVSLAAVETLDDLADQDLLLRLLVDEDPFFRNAAIRQLSRMPKLLDQIKLESIDDPDQRIGLLLAWRRSGRKSAAQRLPEFFSDSDPQVRFMAAKWVADEKLAPYEPMLAKRLNDPGLNIPLLFAYASALARLQDRSADDRKLAEFFLAKANDKQSPAQERAVALRLVPATHKSLKLDHLAALMQQGDNQLRQEAVRAACLHPDPDRFALLSGVASNSELPLTIRTQAVAGLAERAEAYRQELLDMTKGQNVALRDEALRALVGMALSPEEQAELKQLAVSEPNSAPLVSRALGLPPSGDRPKADDLDSWHARLAQPGNAEAGRRIFFHAKLAGCFRCHRIEGRGSDAGPDLTLIGHSDRRAILESILLPSRRIAPHYQTWTILTDDGLARTGLLIHTHLDDQTYVDAQGNTFQVNTKDVVARKAQSTSIMPSGLTDRLTDQELRDLLAYLTTVR